MNPLSRKFSKLVRLIKFELLGSADSVVEALDEKIIFRTRSEREFLMRGVNSYTGENTTMHWIKKVLRPSDVVFDIGANVGSYSLLIGQRLKRSGGKGHVIAFEPESLNFAGLNTNVYLNNLSGVIEPIAMALSGAREFGKFELSMFNQGAATHTVTREKSSASNTPHVQRVMTMSLDDFVGTDGVPFPTALKIDVDGLEHEIIRGGVQTLSDPRVRSLVIELNKDPGLDETMKVITGCGFRETMRESWPTGDDVTYNLLFEK